MLTPDAIELGFCAALPAEFELTEREFGRGERNGADTIQLIVQIDSAGPIRGSNNTVGLSRRSGRGS